MAFRKTRFYAKRQIRSFRDLEVYRKTFSSSVEVIKKIIPKIDDKDDRELKLRDDIVETSLGIPNLIAEASSRRFEDKEGAFKLMEDAMAGCNKMVVYLEQAGGIYDNKLDKAVVEELARSYMWSRMKVLNLLKAWKKFEREDLKKEEKK